MRAEKDRRVEKQRLMRIVFELEMEVDLLSSDDLIEWRKKEFFGAVASADHRVGFTRMIDQRPFIASGAIVLVQNRYGLNPLLFASLDGLHEIDGRIAGSLHYRHGAVGAQAFSQPRAPQPHFLFLLEAVVIAARKNHAEELQLAAVLFKHLLDKRTRAMQ